MNRAILTIGLLILLAPLAAAGTESNPEVRDALDDVAPYPLSTQGADVESVWVHDETEGDLQLTLKLESLTAQQWQAFDVLWSWSANEPRAPIGWGGVRMRFNPTTTQWLLLDGRYPATHYNDWTEAGALVGQATFGSPAYLNWTLPRDRLHFPPNAAFLSWAAHSYMDTPQPMPDGVIHDVALSTRDYQFDLAPTFAGVTAPARPFDLGDADDDAVAAGDLDGAWFTVEDSQATLVVQVANVADLGVADCQVDLWASVGLAATPTTWGVRLDYGINNTWLLDHWTYLEPANGTVVFPTMVLQRDAPGLVQWTFPAPQGLQTASRVDVTAAALAGCPGGARVDNLVAPTADGTPGPPAIAALFALLLVVLTRQRGPGKG